MTGETQLVKASEYSVAERRKWIAEKYFNHIPPALIYKEYKQQFQLTKHSFDKDITAIRQEAPYSVRENYETIVNQTLEDIDSILSNSLEQDDSKTALQAIKHKLDVLKLVNPDRQKVNNLTVNQQNITFDKPLSVEELREMLGRAEPVIKIEPTDDLE